MTTESDARSSYARKRFAPPLPAVLLVALSGLPLAAQGPPAEQADARRALNKVVAFYREKVGYNGAYLWRYAADLSRQEGEGTATATSGWTQPPGTPAVGEAYLDAWRTSGQRVCLDAAVEAAHALVKSQLRSGGWAAHFDLGPEGRRRYAYRVDGDAAGSFNRTTFDDNKTQSALTLLMHVDEALGFEDQQIHAAVRYGLEHVLAAQYRSGGWPQQFSQPADPDSHPPKRASYPESWPRAHPGDRYLGFYTLNDNNMSRIVEMLIEADRIYDRADCREAAIKTGDFFRRAQMPDPQPGWAQQYNDEMHPVWARRFEPPSITGGESQSVMRTLLDLYRYTGEARFLEPIPKALAYYRDSLLPDGRLARFYELETNRPLYFTRDYQLTYDDGDLPTHYAFKVGSRLDAIDREYRRLREADPAELKVEPREAKPVPRTASLARRASALLDQLDPRGAWVEPGQMRHTDDEIAVIEMRTFIRNLDTLARYAGAVP